METVTIPKTEYNRLKRYSSAYFKIASGANHTEREYPYDYKYINKIIKEAELVHKKGHSIKAKSAGEALRKFRRK